jgi:thiol-disulfide isomerase/thioredoxin
MTNYARICLAAAVLSGATVLPARAQSLGLGDPAPKLDLKSFVKGEPVKAFEPGKNYVVEFWATWCGPCKTSIPHLTELQKKNPGVAFVGVSILEEDQDKVKPFVDEMGEKMAYRVALDSVPTKKKGDEGAMAKTWMTASGQNGIPCAFIIDKTGKIAWMGHPMEMETPLAKIVAGTWDLKEAREEKRKAMEVQGKMMKLQQKLVSALNSGNPKEVVTAVEEVISQVPAAEMGVGPMKLQALIKLDEQEKALEYAAKLAKTDLSKQANGLNAIAWSIVDPDAGIKPGKKLIEFALETARHADELAQSKEAGIADTLAKTYFDAGDAAKAIETQERAVRLTKGSPYEAQIDDFRSRLEKYKKAAK